MACIVLSVLVHWQSSYMEYNDFNELPAVLACQDTCFKKASSANPGDGFCEQGPCNLLVVILNMALSVQQNKTKYVFYDSDATTMRIQGQRLSRIQFIPVHPWHPTWCVCYLYSGFTETLDHKGNLNCERTVVKCCCSVIHNGVVNTVSILFWSRLLICQPAGLQYFEG